MTQLRKRTFVFALLSLFLFAAGVACSSSSPQNNARGQGEGSDSADAEQEEQQSQRDEQDGCESPEDSAGFRLAGEVTWDSDIEGIIEDHCVQCHGASEPNLEGYDNAKAAAAQVVDSVVQERMPQGGDPLSQEKKDKLQAWLDAGAPEKAEANGTDEETGSEDENEEDEDPETEDSAEDTEESADCGTTGNTGGDLGTGGGEVTGEEDGDKEKDEDGEQDEDGGTGDFDWDLLLKPEAVKECNDKGRVYHRGREECLDAELAEFACDRDGIAKAFDDINVAGAGAEVDRLTDDGYEIGQCGEYQNEPVVYFYKKGTQDKNGDELPSLFLERLCRTGSPACL